MMRIWQVSSLAVLVLVVALACQGGEGILTDESLSRIAGPPNHRGDIGEMM
jgi:hypothetical protein